MSVLDGLDWIDPIVLDGCLGRIEWAPWNQNICVQVTDALRNGQIEMGNDGKIQKGVVF